MVYFFCNIVLAVFMLWLAFYTAQRITGDTGTYLVNLMFFYVGVAGLMAFTIFASLFAPERLVMLVGKVQRLVTAVFLIHASFYCVLFPKNKYTKFSKIFMYLLDLTVVYVVFICFKSFTLTNRLGITVTSNTIFQGKMAVYFPWTYYDLYTVGYGIVIPGFALLLSLIKAENIENRVDSQRIIINCLGIAFMWCSMRLILISCNRIPLLMSLETFSLMLLLLLFFKGASQSELWNNRLILGGALQTLLLMILPSAIVGFLFITFWPQYKTNSHLFFAIIGGTAIILMTASHQIGKLFDNSSYFRSSRYAGAFEREMASLNFDEDTQVITQKIQEIFTRNIGSSSLSILIDDGHSELATAYSSCALDLSISSNNMGLDALLNSKLQVVFRRQVEAGYAFGAAKGELISILNKAHSDALIVLNEGRHIVGLIFLGPKLSSNVYSDYDFETFNKLYSYFFVVGYFIRNILNQSVIGTVNREIKMSSQIISSIQENMDFIRNPKIDAGYLMVAAHNIGGEFIDFIRLSETKHIFVIGDLSGKGISASMNMVILKSIIRTFLSETKDFKLLVQRVNEFIRFSLPKGSFFAGLFGLLDFSDNTMYYINCAIPALLVYTLAYNNVIEIQGEGRVLGFVSDITPYIKIKKIRLEPGDIVLACTDGLVESHSLRGDEFGKVRVQKTMMENSSYPAQKMVQFVYDDLMQFTQKNLEDDVSIMVLKMNQASNATNTSATNTSNGNLKATNSNEGGK